MLTLGHDVRVTGHGVPERFYELLPGVVVGHDAAKGTRTKLGVGYSRWIEVDMARPTTRLRSSDHFGYVMIGALGCLGMTSCASP